MKKRAISIVLSLLLLLSLVPLTTAPIRAASSGPIRIGKLPAAFPTGDKEGDLQAYGYHWDGVKAELTLRDIAIAGGITIEEPDVTIVLEGDSSILYGAEGGINSMLNGTLAITGSGSLSLTAAGSQSYFAIVHERGDIVIDGCAVTVDHTKASSNLPVAVQITGEAPVGMFSIKVVNGASLDIDGGVINLVGRLLVDGADSAVKIVGAGGLLYSAVMCNMVEINGGSLEAHGGDAGTGANKGILATGPDALRMYGGTLNVTGRIQGGDFMGKAAIGNGAQLTCYSSVGNALAITGDLYVDGDYFLGAATGVSSPLIYSFRLVGKIVDLSEPGPKIVKGSSSPSTAVAMNYYPALDFSDGIFWGVFTKGWAIGGNSILRRVKVMPALLTDDCEGIPESEVGADILPIDAEAQINPRGGVAPYTYSIEGPPWLKIDPATGVLSGTPSSRAEATTATITVIDSDDLWGEPRNRKTVTIAVGKVLGQPLEFYNDGFDIPDSVTGTAIASVDVSGGATGGVTPYIFSMSSHAWLTIDPATGVISGTPTGAAPAGTITVTVTDSAVPADSKSITLKVGQVNRPLYFVYGGAVPQSGLGRAIDPITDVYDGVTGGVEPYFFLMDGPGWLSIDLDTGVITGTPTEPASVSSATITVIDSFGAAASVTIPVGAVISDLFFVNDGFDITRCRTYEDIAKVNLTSGVYGGVPPYTFSKVSGPTWLNVSAAGEMTGRPTLPAGQTFNDSVKTAVIQVKDGANSVKTIEIDVAPVSNLQLLDTHPTQGRYQVYAGVDRSPSSGDELYDGLLTGNQAVQHPHEGVSGGTTPYAWSIEGSDWVKISTLTPAGQADINPPGSTSKGCLFGNRNGLGPRPATTAIVTVTDARGISESIVILVGEITVVGASSKPLSFVPVPANRYDIPGRMVGEAIEPLVDVSSSVIGGKSPWTYSLSDTLGWLSINTSTGVISGTPGVAHVGPAETITVTVTDGNSDRQSFDIVVGAVGYAPLQFARPVGLGIPARDIDEEINPIDASAWVAGGVPGYTFAKTGGPDWLIVSEDGVVTGAPTVGAVITNLEITVTDSATPTPNSKSVLIEVGAVSGVIPPATDSFTFTKLPGFDVPEGTAGVDIALIDVSGGVDGGTGTLTYDIIGPEWLVIERDSGEITGKPLETSAARSAVVIVTDSAGRSRSITIDVGAMAAAPVPLVFANNGFIIPAGLVDKAIIPVGVRGGVSGGTAPYTFGISAGWLDIDPATGVISGTPTAAAGDTSVTVTVTDRNGLTDSITVQVGEVSVPEPVPLKFTKLTGYDIPGSTAYAAILPVNVSRSVSGGTAPYEFDIEGPAWLLIDPATGVISGTPEEDDVTATATTATVIVTDGAAGYETITITVGAVAPAPLRFIKQAGFDIGAGAVDAAIAPRDLSEGVSGGTKPYTYSMVGPSWLKLDRNTGELTGTPTSATTFGSSAFITVRDAKGKTANITINIGRVDGISILSFTKQDAFDVPASVIDVEIEPIDVSGGVDGGTLPYIFEMEGPEWLDIDPATGVITGTPREAAEATSAIITVTDANDKQASITIVVWSVSSAAPLLKFIKLPGHDIPPSTALVGIAPVNVSNGVTGGDGAYTFTIAGPAWLKIDRNTGVITGTPPAAADATTADVTVYDSAQPAASRFITIKVGKVAPVPLAFTKLAGFDIPLSVQDAAITPLNVSGGAANGTAPYSFGIDGPDWLDINPATGIITGTPGAPADAATATITVTDSQDPPASAAITINVEKVYPPLSFTWLAGFDIPESTTGTAITPVDITGGAAGGKPAYAYTIVGPSWLRIGMTTGIITGTPTTAAEATTATVMVIDGQRPVATKTIEITVGQVTGNPVVLPLTFTKPAGADIPAGTVDTAIAPVDLSACASGGIAPYTYSISGPAWLGISAAGIITGTPRAAAGAGSATVTVTDKSGASASFTIAVGAVTAPPGPDPLTFTKPAGVDIPACTAGTAIAPVSVAGGVSGGTAPFTYSISGPAWLSIHPTTGVLSGTPTAAAAATTATITITDAKGVTVIFTLNIAAVSASGGGGTTPETRYIFTTKYVSNLWNWIMFIVLFGWIWMWFI